MPRTNRLSHAEHAQLGSMKRSHGALFSLAYSPLSSGSSKFTCVVSKKVALKAHDRNLLKRRCREAARPLVQALAKPCVLVLTAKKSAAQATFSAIRRDIDTLLNSLPCSRS